MRRIATAINKIKILPSFELKQSGDKEEPAKQSYLEKPKRYKPNNKNQTTFFYATNI